MGQTEKIEFKKVRDFGEIINAAFEFVRQNFKSLSLSLLLIAGPAAILLGIVSGFTNFYALRSQPVDLEDIGGLFIKVCMIVIFGGLVNLLIMGVTYGYINLYLNQEKSNFSVEEVWAEVKKNFGTLLLTSILSMVVVSVATLLLVIPGIFYAIVLSIVFIVKLRENTKYTDLPGRCRKLISGHWWFTLGIMIVTYIIVAVGSFVLQIPQYILSIVKLLGLEPESSVLNNLITVTTSVCAAFSYMFYALFYIVITFHYFSLVEKKEAVGLMDKLNSIAETN